MTDLSVPKNILYQLGGNRFITMTGAKNLAGDTNTLSFKIMRNAKKVTHVKITLNALDLYDMEFLACNVRTGIKLISNYDNVYAEDLERMFRDATGLETSLGTMGR